MGVILEFTGKPSQQIGLRAADGDGDESANNARDYLKEEKRRVYSESLKGLITEAKRVGEIADASKTDIWGDLRAKVPVEIYPDRLILQQGEPIYDYDVSDAGMVASQRFRDLVEEFDPGVHQFVPVAVEDHVGTSLGTWYFVRFLRPVNALRTEGSKDVPMVIPRDPRGEMGAVHIRSQSVFTVRADRIEGFGAWREKRATDQVFLSEALWQRLAAAELTGIQAGVHFDET